MVAGSAWKYISSDNGLIYRMQVTGIDGKTRNIVEKTLEDWEQTGEGWNNNGQILFFVKTFPDTEKWTQWIKNFKSFNLKILDLDGKSKKEIIAKNPISDGNTTVKARTCSKCGREGHNKAGCKTQFRKTKATDEEKKQEIISDLYTSISTLKSDDSQYSIKSKQFKKINKESKNKKIKTSVKPVRQNTCSKCHQKGHNARKCQML